MNVQRTLSVSDAAALFGVTSKTVRCWIRAGMPPARAGGKGPGAGALIDVDSAVTWLEQVRRPDARERRVAREIAAAAAAVRTIADRDRFRLAQLRAVADRIAPLVAKMNDVSEVHRLLVAEIDEVFQA